MLQWQKRTPEIANLLNPAFCGLVIYTTVAEYQKKVNEGLPFPLMYLILPIILHKNTRNRITSKTNMVVWLQQYQDILVGFPVRARNLVSFTNEAIEFLLYHNNIIIENKRAIISKKISKAKINRYISADQEISECISKAAHVGRWFYNMRSVENIYAAWGVKP